MGLRHKSIFFFIMCLLLIEAFNSKVISSTIPEQGSQVCNVFLVSGKYGVPDKQLSASSEFDAKHAAKYGRINTTFVMGLHIGAWAARYERKGEYIQVELNNLSLIHTIQTQGRNNTGENPPYFQYVKNYKVSYRKNEEEEWIFVNDQRGINNWFPGNDDQNSIKINQLVCPFEARYVRIITWDFESHPAMRFDLTGCLLTEESSTTDCGFDDGLCGWTQETGNDLLHWKRQNYTGREDISIPGEFSENCTGNCSFLALVTKNSSNTNISLRSADLIRFIQRSSTPRFLRVWSTAMNLTSAYINVTVIGCLHESVNLSSKIVNISHDGWTPVSVDVKPMDYQLSINGGWTAGDQGYLVIDQILLITGICPDCDFENNLCNWNNTGSVNWNLTSEGSRKFISSEVAYNGTGLAQLVGPVINISESMMSQTCLRFSFSINGSADNTLLVYSNTNGLKSPLWNWTGSSQGWIIQNINILNGSDFQIEFEGKVEYGMVNIDDIFVLYGTCLELPATRATPVSNNRTVTTGSSGRKQNDFGTSDTMRIYLGVGFGFFAVLVASVISLICKLRRKRRTRNSKMGVIQLDDGKDAKHLEQCEYANVVKKSGKGTIDKIETDFGQIYENQCKQESHKINKDSTPEVDQLYNHIVQDEKPPNLNDATYDHVTVGRKLCGQIAHMPSDVPNESLHQLGDGDGENEETYSNVPICRK